MLAPLLALLLTLSLSRSRNHVSKLSVSMKSERVGRTEAPYIENVLDRYAHLQNVTTLALGSSFWGPPKDALMSIVNQISARDVQRYGNILGMPALRERLSKHLQKQGLDTDSLEIAITAGANQAFMNVALMLCDSSDRALALAPYYFSHKLSLQLCQVQVDVADFDPHSLIPNWESLDSYFASNRPKLVVVTSPNNPSGVVWGEGDLTRLVQLCRQAGAWLVVDQTYYEFLYDGAKHTFPCSRRFHYEKIVHVFSLSKVFGMPGWRVGYTLYPKSLSEHMRKIQDTIPTHTTILSQKLALAAMETYSEDLSNDWFGSHLSSLSSVREALWPVLEKLGTKKTQGAFYFLVPLPPLVDEEEAVDILANEYGVLLMHGSPFGAKGYLRLSYGSIPPGDIISAIGKIERGVEHLMQLSKSRC